MPVIQFGSDQSGFNMHLLILFLCFWVCEGVRCPFPGITATADFVDVSTIQTNRTFHEGDVVEYHCPGDWQENSDQKYSLTCQSDGTWSGPLPRCSIQLRRSDGTLTVKYGRNPSNEWTGFYSCDSGKISNYYSFSLAKGYAGFSYMFIVFCSRYTTDLLYNVTLDGDNVLYVNQQTALYKCRGLCKTDSVESGIYLKKEIPLFEISVVATPEINCGWPPVPVDADVAEKVEPGRTTQVTYKCRDPLVVDPKGPQSSSCNQRTGQWTPLPKCTCRDPDVPAKVEIVHLQDFLISVKCNDRLVLDPDGPENSTCDPVTGGWSQLPRCICPDPHVPAHAEVAERTGYSTRFRCAEGFRLTAEEKVTCDDTGTWNASPSCQLSGASVAAIFLSVALLLIILLFTLRQLKKKELYCFSTSLKLAELCKDRPEESAKKVLDRSSQHEPEDPQYDELILPHLHNQSIKYVVKDLTLEH